MSPDIKQLKLRAQTLNLLAILGDHTRLIASQSTIIIVNLTAGFAPTDSRPLNDQGGNNECE
uniref:hypothetical protein n=1 Tax=Vaginimicrobium propionicum TaxID=1871034 RepID=UPI00097112EA|nr:hypothetical protein [Vaginimicrobium propionicum]